MSALFSYLALASAGGAALLIQRAHVVRLTDDDSRFLTAALSLGCIWIGIASLVARRVLA